MLASGEMMKQAWWETRWFAATLIALSVVPLLYPDFPPLVDLPSHMGRYQIALGNSDLLARFYKFEWHLSGNLGADLLIVPLSGLLGPEEATKVVAMLIPPLLVSGLLAIGRSVDGRLSPTAAMVVPLVYTQPFLFGFLNYMLAVTLAIWALHLFRQLGGAGRLGLRAVLMVPLGLLLFITHAAGWGILGLCAFAGEWVRIRDAGCRPLGAAGKAALQMTPLLPPLLLLLLWQSGAAGATTGWFLWNRKLIWTALLFRDLWPVADRLTAVFVAAFALLLLTARWCRIDRAIGLGSLGVFGAFLLLPFQVFGSALSDMRLLPVALMLLFIAVQPRTEGRMAQLVAIAATGLAVARMAITTAAFTVAGDWQQGQISVLDKVERGARIAVAAGPTCGSAALPRNDHLGSIAIVRKEAFVNDQFYLPGSVSVVIDYPEAGSYASAPSQHLSYDVCGPAGVELWMSNLPANAFDYVWMLGADPMPPSYADRWHLAAERPGSRLYRKIAQSGGGTGQNPTLGPKQPAQ